MASKSTTATRASTRSKAGPVTPAPTTTRTTRARTKAAGTTPVETESAVTKKSNQRKPLVSRDNAVETKIPAAKAKSKATGRKVTKATRETEPEPIMVSKRVPKTISFLLN